MRIRSHRLPTLAPCLLGLAATLSPSPAPAGEPRAWEVSRGNAVIVCPLTVGGSFEAKSTALAGRLVADPDHAGRLTGGIALDLAQLDSGIAFRNQHMRDKYLEVGKGEGFDHAQLTDLELEGLDPTTALGTAAFTASLRLHGVSRRVRGEAKLRGDGRVVHVEATFPIATSDYGIARTVYLGVGVKNDLRVKVELDATAATAAAASAGLAAATGP